MLFFKRALGFVGKYFNEIAIIVSFYGMIPILSIINTNHAFDDRPLYPILSYVWVWVHMLLDACYFYMGTEKKEYKKRNFIVKLEFDINSYVHNYIKEIIPGDLSEMETRWAIEREFKEAIHERIKGYEEKKWILTG